MRDLLQQIAYHALATPSAPAFMLADRVITFGMVQSGIDAVRDVLLELRLDPDACVGVNVDNPARHFIIALALTSNGHAFAPLRADLLPAAKAAGVRTVITESPLPADGAIRAIFANDTWFTRTSAARRPLPRARPDRIVKVSFTSGSTGRPKAIGDTARTQAARAQAMFMLGMGRHRRIMSAYGMSGPGFLQALQALSCGRTICFAPPGEMLRVMIYYDIEEFRGSVGQIRSIVDEHDALGRPMRLRQVSAGGAYLSPQQASAIRASFGADVISPYAAVECGWMGCAGGDLLRLRQDRGNCYAVTCDLEIVDEDGSVLPVGAEGRIRVRSPQTSRPFTGDLVEPAGASDAWVFPGDMGRLEEDGLLVVTGRVDEIINYGGAKTDPEVIETVLASHPAIADAATLRMHAADGTQEAWAVVVARAPITLDGLNAWLASRLAGELGAYRFARLECVDAIPRTESAKIARAALRATLMRG